MVSTSVFAIASLDKGITATGVFKAAELGKLSLADPITRYVDVPLPGVSLATLLSHTSGLPDFDQAIAEKPKCAVMAHYGEKDEHIPVDGVKKLAAAHPSVTVHLYPAPHGFNCDQRGSYDAASAKLARSRTLEFFRKQLG